ncbi:glycosyltransferase [Breznakiellaceae bacterium SP9]
MKVAVVHYWLVNMRGGEKVLEAILDMFPGADIFTHVYDPAAVSPAIRSHRVYTSYIQKLPFAAKLYQKYMPLMPNALKEFDLQDYDVVISSESGPAKGVVPNPDAFHICYCHSPMRYLWDMYHDYFRRTNPLTRFFMKKLIPGLRLWDTASSNLVDCFVANSHYVAKRIKRYYRREAQIIYPPVAIEKFIPIVRAPEDFYLFFGQLTAYKRSDIAIEACIMLKRRLIVAGAGADNATIKHYADTGLVRFTGRLSDEEIASYYSKAKALLFPGIEDFGIIPVEAQAAGCPVLAFRKGGVLDTVTENVTGIFFDEQTPEALAGAITAFESMEGRFADREAFTAHVQQFSKEAFSKRFEELVAQRRAH